MAKRQLVPAAGGAGLKLPRGEHLRIIDLDGGQTGDLMALSQDGRERLSNGRTFDYGGKIYLSTGDVLWSDRELGIERDSLPTAFNFFMNLPDGRLKSRHPKCRAGDSMVLRAEMDLAIALSACPGSTCNGGAPPRPLSLEIPGP